MHLPRTSGFARLGLTALLGALMAACVADEPSSAHGEAGGSAGSASQSTSSGGSSTGGSTTTGVAGTSSNVGGGTASGQAGTGGTGGTGEIDAGPPPKCQLSTPTAALITDFKPYPNGATDSYAWGDFGSGFSGFSYFYPGALVSDVSSSAWHLSGMVSEYAGFALAFVCGTDASAYDGVQFTISGSIGAPGALTFSVPTASDEPIDPNKPNDRASCTPVNNQYDGTCAQPSTTIAVSSTKKTVTLKWSDLTGGRPNPVKPGDIIALRWIFGWPVMGSDAAAVASYPVDVTIDDVTFVGGAADAGMHDTGAATDADAATDAATPD